jgi:hypothetical protein
MITETNINEEQLKAQEAQENDYSIQRSATMPHLLFKICRKYNISISEALQEGALLLLNMNDKFSESDDVLENLYRKGKYVDKRNALVSTIAKISGGSK